MEMDKRITYHMTDGSIVEIIGMFVEKESHENGIHTYTMEGGKVYAIYDGQIVYRVTSDAPEGGGEC